MTGYKENMNLESYNYNVPDYVSNADPSKFDTSSRDAVVYGGFRLDNPAAVWVAGAEMRKNASELDAAIRNKIATAMGLFGIDDSSYTMAKVASSVTISDGENTAEFSIYDNESLNEAARGLLDKRANLPYAFAHDCAVALRNEALTNGYEFDEDTLVPIRKLAGAYHVDFSAGKKLLEEAASEAAEAGLEEHSGVLSKLANMCEDNCTEESAPYFIAALDEFNRSGVSKKASDRPENVFYISNNEAAQKKARERVTIDNTRSITFGSLTSAESKQRISKWASMCGYCIASNSTEKEIVDKVSAMPETLRQEFVELFA